MLSVVGISILLCTVNHLEGAQCSREVWMVKWQTTKSSLSCEQRKGLDWDLSLCEGPQDMEKEARVFWGRHWAVGWKGRPRFFHQMREWSFKQVWQRGDMQDPGQLILGPAECQVHIFGTVQQFDCYRLVFLCKDKSLVEEVRYDLGLNPDPRKNLRHLLGFPSLFPVFHWRDILETCSSLMDTYLEFALCHKISNRGWLELASPQTLKKIILVTWYYDSNIIGFTSLCWVARVLEWSKKRVKRWFWKAWWCHQYSQDSGGKENSHWWPYSDQKSAIYWTKKEWRA